MVTRWAIDSDHQIKPSLWLSHSVTQWVSLLYWSQDNYSVPSRNRSWDSAGKNEICELSSMGGLDLDCWPPADLDWLTWTSTRSAKLQRTFFKAKDINNMRLILAQSYCRTLRPLKLKVCLESWAINRGMVMGRLWAESQMSNLRRRQTTCSCSVFGKLFEGPYRIWQKT